jgi:hypothetical protein
MKKQIKRRRPYQAFGRADSHRQQVRKVAWEQGLDAALSFGKRLSERGGGSPSMESVRKWATFVLNHPAFRTSAALAAWRREHPGEPEPRTEAELEGALSEPSLTRLNISLPTRVLDAIKLRARKCDVPYEDVIKVWLGDKVFR